VVADPNVGQRQLPVWELMLLVRDYSGHKRSQQQGFQSSSFGTGHSRSLQRGTNGQTKGSRQVGGAVATGPRCKRGVVSTNQSLFPPPAHKLLGSQSFPGKFTGMNKQERNTSSSSHQEATISNMPVTTSTFPATVTSSTSVQRIPPKINRRKDLNQTPPPLCTRYSSRIIRNSTKFGLRVA